jgi:hypothetical protein
MIGLRSKIGDLVCELVVVRAMVAMVAWNTFLDIVIVTTHYPNYRFSYSAIAGLAGRWDRPDASSLGSWQFNVCTMTGILWMFA